MSSAADHNSSVRRGLPRTPSRTGGASLPRSVMVLVALSIFLLVAGILYVARAILIPVAMSILITFLLAPLVKRIQRFGVPRVPAVLIVVSTTVAALAGVGGLIGTQIYELTQELPDHKQQIKENVRDVTGTITGTPDEEESADGTAPSTGGGAATGEENVQDQKKKEGIGDLVKEVKSTVKESTGESESMMGMGPMPVRVVDDQVVPSMFTTVVTNASGPLGTAGLVFVLVLFLLFKHDDMRNRLVTLSGRTNLAVTTQALDEAGKRISRYLLMQFIINVTYGFCVALGLFLIGVDYAALWGVCATLLRYIPYLGPWVAATLPIGYSFLTSDSWMTPAGVIVLVLVLELLVNNFFEPLLYGRGVGISAVAVILSAIFWGWLWGAVGLILATPLTACLVVAGRYVPALALFNRFLSDTPDVEQHFVYYQRLLARDEDEAEDVLEKVVEDSSLAEACESILVPTLSTLKYDRARGVVTDDQLAYILDAIDDHIEEATRAQHGSPEESAGQDTPLFLGYGVRGPEDEAAALIAGRLVANESCRFKTISNDSLFSEVLDRIRTEEPSAVCLFCVPPGGLVHTRRLCKRLSAARPGMKIVLGYWGRALGEKHRTNLPELGVTAIARTPEETREQIHSLARIRRPTVAVSHEADSPSDEEEFPAATESHFT